jgi:hypothetical protein
MITAPSAVGKLKSWVGAGLDSNSGTELPSFFAFFAAHQPANTM